MTSCKNLGNTEDKKTEFSVKIDITDRNDVNEIIRHLKEGQDKLMGCAWMKQLAEIIEKG